MTASDPLRTLARFNLISSFQGVQRSFIPSTLSVDNPSASRQRRSTGGRPLHVGLTKEACIFGDGTNDRGRRTELSDAG